MYLGCECLKMLVFLSGMYRMKCIIFTWKICCFHPELCPDISVASLIENYSENSLTSLPLAANIYFTTFSYFCVCVMYLALICFIGPYGHLKYCFVEFSHGDFPDDIRQQYNVITLEYYLQYGAIAILT